MLSPTGAGGVHQYAWMLAGALEARGVGVTLAVARGFETVPTAGPSRFLELRGPGRPGGYPADAARVVREARDHDVAHVQAPLWSLADGLALVPALRRSAGVVGATLHEALPYRRRRYHPAAYRRYYTAVERVAVHSESHRTLLDQLGARPRVVGVTPFGDHGAALGEPDPEFRPRRRLDLGDRRLVLFFGIVRPQKGLHDLIDALAGTRETTSLLVAGEPLEPVDGYRAHAEEAGVDLVLADDYLRYLEGPRAAACLGDADVLALPYRSGANSGVLSLAGAFGIPTVATSAVAPPEYLALVPPGGVCEPRDVAGLRAGIRGALDGDLAPPARFPTWDEAAEAYLALWSSR